MTSTYLPKGWEDDILTDLGAPPDASSVTFLDDWFDTEHGDSGATGGVNEGGALNPFDTTLPEPGSSSYNSIGVQDYPTWKAGLTANVSTLEESPYSTIVSDLKQGASVSQLEDDVDASPWGTHFDVGATMPTPANSGTAGSAAISGGTTATLDSYPGGSVDPLNWPSEISGAESSLAKILLELVFVGLGAALIVVGGYKAAGKDAPSMKSLAGMAAV